MRWASAFIVLILSATAALAQSGGAQVYNSFAPVMRAADMALTTTPSAEALPVTLTGQIPSVAWVCNEGPDLAYVALGGASLTVSQAVGFPLPPGRCSALNAGGTSFIAALADTATATLQITMGYGRP